MNKVFVRTNSKEVLKLVEGGKYWEAFRIVRHKYSNYDRIWKSLPASEYGRVAEELRVAVIAAYPALAGVVIAWKA